jgi:outer membrane protein OmpA-like peptidoglycan-associated protein
VHLYMIGVVIAVCAVVDGCVTRQAELEPRAVGPPITFPVIPQLAPVSIEKVTARERIVLENVLFDLDKARLRPEGKATVEKAAAYLDQYSNDRVVIEGHACALGSEEHNLALGMRRAEAVKNYLVAQGIASERIRTISYGESRPLADNTAEEGRALNRRAVIEIEEGR